VNEIVRNWSITVNYSSYYIRLWLVNFLLLQPHPLLLLLIVDHALLYCATFNFNYCTSIIVAFLVSFNNEKVIADYIFSYFSSILFNCKCNSIE